MTSRSDPDALAGLNALASVCVNELDRINIAASGQDRTEQQAESSASAQAQQPHARPPATNMVPARMTLSGHACYHPLALASANPLAVNPHQFYNSPAFGPTRAWLPLVSRLPKEFVLQYNENNIAKEIRLPTPILLRGMGEEYRAEYLMKQPPPSFTIHVRNTEEFSMRNMGSILVHDLIPVVDKTTYNERDLDRIIQTLTDLNNIVEQLHLDYVQYRLLELLAEGFQVAKKFPRALLPSPSMMARIFERTSTTSRFRSLVVDVWAWHSPRNAWIGDHNSHDFTPLPMAARLALDDAFARQSLLANPHKPCGCLACVISNWNSDTNQRIRAEQQQAGQERPLKRPRIE